MDHTEHVRLLREGIPGAGGVWADFGSGSGAFTLALADLIGPSGRIYSLLATTPSRFLDEIYSAVSFKSP